MKRVLIVRDEKGQWFLRGVAYNHEDRINGEMVYHCIEHLGGPFAALHDAMNQLAIVDSKVSK